MSAKILISAMANTGKTSLLKSLTDAYVISRDGKKFPLEIPHTNFTDFSGMENMIHGYESEDDEGNPIHVPGINDKIIAYNEAFGKYPKTVAIDSVSKILQDIIDYANVNFKGFDIHSTINKEIALLTNYIEETLIGNGMNVVLISHAMYDEKSENYVMVGQGKFQQKGGFLSEVDYASFIELKGKKRVIHHKNPKLASRSLLEEVPDVQPIADLTEDETDEHYNLQAHIDMIVAKKDKVEKFAI